MDSLRSETCWSTFKYFIILIVSTNYIFVHKLYNKVFICWWCTVQTRRLISNNLPVSWQNIPNDLNPQRNIMRFSEVTSLMNISISESTDSYRHQTRSRVLKLLHLRSHFGTPNKCQSVAQSCTVIRTKADIPPSLLSVATVRYQLTCRSYCSF